ncbi:uncharacterized protein LOC135833500 [Planococcus citri]|uniref:uncharacterized protein LOC135833500 n=1 Tax=Planococcus citri TaxID=170843 RepID=UPI0031F9755D
MDDLTFDANDATDASIVSNAASVRGELMNYRDELGRELSNLEKVQKIAQAYLRLENFYKESENPPTYYRKGEFEDYTFVLTTLPMEDGRIFVELKREKNLSRNRGDALECAPIKECPALVNDDVGADNDRQIIINIMRRIRRSFEYTWSYLHLDVTPEISSDDE